MGKLQIIWVSKTYAAPKSVVKIHQHPYYHMFHIRSGSVRFAADGKEYLLQAGQSVLVPCGIDHGYTNDEDVTMEDFEIKFQLLQNVTDAPPQQLGVIITESSLVGELVEQIVQEYADLGSGADDAAEAYMVTLLKLLTKQQRYEKKRNFRFVAADSYSPLSQRIIRYLEKNYAKDINLDTLASELDYNKSYLCVAFKRETQLTIVDCLNMIRIRRAAELIVYSDHSLSHVASMCGFASDSHFTRMFTKYVGISPGQCRRMTPENLVYEPKDSFRLGGRPSRFIYNVLAQKQFSLEKPRSAAEQKDTEE